MGETAQSIKSNTVILISRNTPVAVVCGAGSFLGSHLADKLLSKNIQVVGIDNFEIGKKENLEEASKNKNFHLINGTLEEINFQFPRLDYLFVIPEQDSELEDVLKIFKSMSCRLLIVSSIELYQAKASKDLEWLRQAEVKVAKFAHENHLNARILRLGAIFGPRMSFQDQDPINKLIKAAVTGELQKEINLDFSTRALYIEDAVDLVIKSMLSGATALKIFDGVLHMPIKVSEVKQVLLDPVWYENKGFKQTELPPWTTPNLEKTMRILNWEPGTKLVFALKKTLNYFRTHEVTFNEQIAEENEEKKKKVADMTKDYQSFFTTEIKQKVSLGKPKNGKLKGILAFCAMGIIAYAIIWPLITLTWGIFSFKIYLSEAIVRLEKGEFNESLNSISLAEEGIEEARVLLREFEVLRKAAFLNNIFEGADNLVSLAKVTQVSAKSTIIGIQSLFQGLKAVTGEINEDPKSYFRTAQIELAKADAGFAKAEALMINEEFKSAIPVIFKDRISSLENKIRVYTNIVEKARASAVLLPQVVALDGKKSYLVLLQNNMELRPTGGFIGSFAKIDFEGGKLKNLQVNDIYAIDGQLKVHVEPPKEIREDLGQKDWYLRDSNFEPDFPTSARQAEWFFNKETGEMVEGVISLDVSAIEDLLGVVGPLDLTDYGERVTAENLFEKAVSHAEQDFFPGSQAKKTFLTTLTRELFNKLFFLPRQNWPGIVTVLGKSLEGKHISFYFNDPKLFSYVHSQNWTGALPRNVVSDNETIDFLAPVEANLGGNKANYYLDRNYKLETAVLKDGEIDQRLTINYINRSPQDTWPGGLYKNRFRVYLPFGVSLIAASWDGGDITKDVTNFVDYGRSGFSMLLELKPKEEKKLIIEYQLPGKLKFINNKATYRLNVLKQSGTLKDPFEWKISYPINYSIVSNQTLMLAPQEQTISTDLSRDRSFELTFSKGL